MSGLTGPGTWLGVTRGGRLAVLTNYREESSAAAMSVRSRGAVVTAFLTAAPSATDEWVRTARASSELAGAGGFSMLCGTLRPGHGPGANLEPLAVVSNRPARRPADPADGTANGDDDDGDDDAGLERTVHWVAGRKGETGGLSNSLWDRPWPKVELGEQLLADAVARAVARPGGTPEPELVELCFGVLSHDTLPRFSGSDTYRRELDALRSSIFIPPFAVASEPAVQLPSTPSPAHTSGPGQQQSPLADAATSPMEDADMSDGERERWRHSPRLYATAQQTVILVDARGRLKYVERTLYDREARPLATARDVTVEFAIEGWPAAS